MKTFIYIVIIIVVAAVVAGFFIVDSPKESRLKKFDEQRISDLSFLQGEIINYWTRKGKLPETLENLNDDMRGFSVPTDPESGQEYGYNVKGKYDFTLCANFNRETFVMTTNFKGLTVPEEDRWFVSNDWKHLRGNQCFFRTIDPVLYPPVKR